MKEVAGSANTSVAAALSDVKIPSNADAKSSTPVVHSSPVSVTPVGVVATTPARPSPGSSSVPHGDSGVQTDAAKVQSPAETASTATAGADVSENVGLPAASADASALPVYDIFGMAFWCLGCNAIS